MAIHYKQPRSKPHLMHKIYVLAELVFFSYRSGKEEKGHLLLEHQNKLFERRHRCNFIFKTTILL
ncbi:hypothetical protein HZS_7478 [Henneguya salminicola]|nr:hypothetical protein HZS_7478 [Henneguya salminicola]